MQKLSRFSCVLFYFLYGIRISSGIFRVKSERPEFSGSIPDGFRGEPDLLSVSVSEYSGPIPDDHENCITVRDLVDL